jgi:lysozyme family protein
MDLFQQAFAVVVGHEGAYDVTRADPGNWTGGRVGEGRLLGTKYGLSAASYPDLHIAALSLEDAQAIYRRDYWDRMSADRLPPALALLMLDAGINNGVSRASCWLQSIVGAEIDGRIGDKSVAAAAAYVAAHGAAALCVELLAQRLIFMAGLPTWPIFGLGWGRRLCALPYQSLAFGVQ